MGHLRSWILVLAVAIAPNVVQAQQPPSKRVEAFYRRVMHPTKAEIASPRFSSLQPYLGRDLWRALSAFKAYENACARMVPPDVKPYMLDQSPFFQAPDGAKTLVSTTQEVHGNVARVFVRLAYDYTPWTDTVLLGKEKGRWVILDIQWGQEEGATYDCTDCAHSLTQRLVAFARESCAPTPGLARYLQALDADHASRYAAAARDLDGDGVTERLLLMEGPAWCGSGGCTLLVLERKGKAFKERARVSVMRAPIRMASTTSHGWRDLIVRVGGGGMGAQDAVLHFDGARYPGTATVPPAKLRPADDQYGEMVLDVEAYTRAVW